jgi:hypothetical protein
MQDLRVTLRVAFHVMRGDERAVVRIYAKELEAEPDHPAALGPVLSHYRAQSLWSEVASYAERALTRNPKDFLALDALAWARVAEGRHQEAKLLMERALRTAEGLRLELPSGFGMRLLHAACVIPVVLVKRVKLSRVPTVGQINVHNAHWLAKWEEEARGYLAWYADAYKS